MKIKAADDMVTSTARPPAGIVWGKFKKNKVPWNISALTSQR